MGLLDKVMFWKKSDDFSDLGLGLEGDFGGDHTGKGSDFGLDKDLTGLDGAGTGRRADRNHMPTPSHDLPGFGDQEHFSGADTPLSASRNSPQTPEVNSGSSNYSTYPPHPSSMPPPPSPSRSNSDYIISKDLEIISAKIDALRAGIDSISHRLAAIERIARGDNERNW